jgi:hypothetical protein
VTQLTSVLLTNRTSGAKRLCIGKRESLVMKRHTAFDPIQGVEPASTSVRQERRHLGTVPHDSMFSSVPSPQAPLNGVERKLERKLEWPTGTESGTVPELLFELGVEPSLTIREAATILRWSYWKARRHFREAVEVIRRRLAQVVLR